MALALLLTACPNLPPPDRLAFDSDPRILRGSYLGTVDTREVPTFMALAGDSSVLAASWPGKVDVWDLNALERITTIDLPTGEDDWIGGLDVDASGSLVAGLLAGDVLLWNAYDGSLVRRFDSGDRLGACRYCGVYALSLSPAGDILAAAGGAPRVLLFDTTTGSIVRELTTVGEDTALVAFNSTGTMLAAASTLSDTRYALRVWETTNYAVLFDLEGTIHHSRYPRFAVSADGKRLAVRSSSKVELFDIAGAVTVVPMDEMSAGWAIALNPDGTQLAFDSGTDATTDMFVIEVATGAVLAEFPNVLRGQPTWSDDGNHLIADANLTDTVDFEVINDFAVGQLYSLLLEATPEYVDPRTYTVSGSISIDGGTTIGFSGTVDGQEGQRYLQPQARLPNPATLEIRLDDHPWRLHAQQPYSLEYWTDIAPDGWSGTMSDDTSDDSTWHPFRLWRAP